MHLHEKKLQCGTRGGKLPLNLLTATLYMRLRVRGSICDCVRVAVEQMPKKPGTSPGKTKKNSNRKRWGLNGGWLILLANIWIVAFMALIHRVECVPPLPRIWRPGKGERCREKRACRRETTACLHYLPFGH